MIYSFTIMKLRFGAYHFIAIIFILKLVKNIGLQSFIGSVSRDVTEIDFNYWKLIDKKVGQNS